MRAMGETGALPNCSALWRWVVMRAPVGPGADGRGVTTAAFSIASSLASPESGASRHVCEWPTTSQRPNLRDIRSVISVQPSKSVRSSPPPPPSHQAPRIAHRLPCDARARALQAWRRATGLAGVGGGGGGLLGRTEGRARRTLQRRKQLRLAGRQAKRRKRWIVFFFSLTSAPLSTLLFLIG
ncbi:hypothetical protein F4780DRAFT_625821 [Xylariomycetidae sp. FL0641]|nr:hypothetical protein F4780DRAFT_625821 [Xylariomycetidae sp. FL0641]